MAISMVDIDNIPWLCYNFSNKSIKDSFIWQQIIQRLMFLTQISIQ